MRRGVSFALLLMMCAALAAPSALAIAFSPTPACCRTSGRHQCMAPAGDGFRATTPGCPYRRPLPFHQSARPQPAAAAQSAPDEHPFLREFYPQLFPAQAERSHSGRGPPSSGFPSR